MRSCREISALVSQSLDKKLSFTERFEMSLHLMICSQCRNFRKQTLFIRKAAHRYVDHLQKQPKKK